MHCYVAVRSRGFPRFHAEKVERGPPARPLLWSHLRQTHGPPAEAGLGAERVNAQGLLWLDFRNWVVAVYTVVIGPGAQPVTS